MRNEKLEMKNEEVGKVPKIVITSRRDEILVTECIMKNLVP